MMAELDPSPGPQIGVRVQETQFALGYIGLTNPHHSPLARDGSTNTGELTGVTARI